MPCKSRFDTRPRPMTDDEARAASVLTGEHVTRSWLVRLADGSRLEILQPPAMHVRDRRHGHLTDLTAWRLVEVPELLDPPSFRAALAKAADLARQKKTTEGDRAP